MLFKFLFIPLCLLAGLSNPAQGHSGCSEGHIQRAAQKGTVLSPMEDQYDVSHVKLDISMSNIHTYIAGNATTTAKVVAAGGMNVYAFELNPNMIIDSMKVNGRLVTAINPSTYLRTAALPDTLRQNTTFTAQVFYHGAAANGTGFFNGGIVNTVLSSGTMVTYTMSDDYFAKDWWPAKQSLQDKIDSADIWVTIPAGLKAGSNGLLKRITPLGSSNRYEWKTNYPIDYYLISAAVAPYVEHTQTVHFTGSTDTMLVQHYMYDTLSTNNLYRAALDSTIYMIDHFSTLFGRYPFWKEKYGHCMAPLSGGMEHQTMTTLGAFTTPLIAHELGHQWWGDAVTYSSWRDIWMSEGWASYCEQLYVERFRSAAAALTYRTSVFNRVMTAVGGSVYVYDTTNVSRTFDSRLTYDKGAAVAHMLRYAAPDDATYFRGLQNYQQQFAFKTANTEDFKNVMEAAYGYDLDTFFNQWVYQEGYPIYSVRWNQAGGLKILELTQTSSKPASVPFFKTPLDIKILSASGDTTIRIYNNQPVQWISLNWNQTMTGLKIDPDNHILNKEGAISREAYLSVSAVTGPQISVSPNPATDSWQAVGLPVGAHARLYNMAGQLVWEMKNTTAGVSIPAAALAPGTYQFVVSQKGMISARHKLVRW